MAEYPPPTESLPIFDYSQFQTVTGAGLTQGEADNLYLGRQGSATSIASDTSFSGSVSCSDGYFVNVSNSETASFRDLQAYNTFTTTTGTPSTFNGTADFNDVATFNSTIVLPDGTTQTSAYTGAALFAGSYTNTNLTVNSQGKITALASGTGGGSGGTNAITAVVNTTDSASTLYPLLSTVGASQNIYADNATTPLSYVPVNGTLTASNFVGSLSGNATSSGYSTYSAVISGASASALVALVNGSGGNEPIRTSGALLFNSTNGTLSTTTFSGALSGNATSSTTASKVATTSDNTAGTYFIPFTKTATSSEVLFVDNITGPLTYNPSTSTLSASAYTITGTPATSTVASQFGQVGLVKLQTLTTVITGAATAVNFNLANIFTSAYTNYRIILSPTTQVSFTQYPNYGLAGFLGSGTMPTTGSLFGYEMTSGNSALVAPVYIAGATLSSVPLIFAASSLTNKQVVFEVNNVGFAATQAQTINMTCKSFYANPGVNGTRDANILCSYLSGTTITGLTIQQSILGAGNNFTLQAIIYGYNQL